MTDNFDFESDARDGLETSGTTSQKVLDLVKEMVDLEKKIGDLSVQLEALQKKKKEVEELKLPLAMDEANISELKLATGQKLSLKPIIATSIPKENEGQAYDWMRDNNYGDLIKRTVSSDFGRGEDQKASELIELLTKQGFSVKDKSGVHFQTLQAWGKEQYNKGVTLPANLFTTFVGRKAILASK